MEVASPRRAALRLAALAGVTAAPLVLLSVTAYRWAAPDEPTPIAVAPAAIEAAPAWPRATTTSARFVSDTTPVRVAQVEAIRIPASVLADPPAANEGQIIRITADATDRFAGYRPPGAMVVQNPAAMGPPEASDEPPTPVVTTPSFDVAPPSVAAVRDPLPAPAAPPRERAPRESQTRVPMPTPPVVAGEDSSVEPSAETYAPPPESILTPVTYTASTSDLSRRLEPHVQDGFRLGRAGAVYAARAQFVRVLRQIARAKDAEQGGTRFSAALADGLRALDDADDFVARGDALEAELDVAAIARSHTVDLIPADSQVAPHEAIEAYSNHAAARLAEATLGEPAGSMALYGLGKTYARLESQSDDPTAGRKSAVMYRAAVDAQPNNYLAANELGVRLASMGRYDQASRVLRTAAQQPGSIAMVHANLAAVENRLGRGAEAAQAQRVSHQLAAHERARGDVSRRMGVQWVDPGAFALSGPATTRPAQATPASPPQSSERMPDRPADGQDEAGGWTGFVQAAKRVTGWSKTNPSQAAAPRAPVVTPRVLR